MMMMMLPLLLGVVLPRAAAAAPLRLGAGLVSGMVLQRAPRSARLFGTAPAGCSVEVALLEAGGGGGTVKARASADASGQWVVGLPPQPASRGRTLTISSSGSSTITLKGVAFGEVLFCTGQSNMAVNVGNRLMMNQSAELAAAHTYDIRLLNNGVMWPPIGTPPNESWAQANASSLASFSNLCWLSGRDLYRSHELGGRVTVGLVSSCVGGTGIEQYEL